VNWPMDEDIVKPGEDRENSTWEYGFYDDADTSQTIWWYLFGLPHTSAESALHTGRKNVWGQAVIVRRRPGSNQWEEVES